MKKVLCLFAAAGLLFAMAGCTKTLHCDKCNKEIAVKANSNANEDWAVYCDDCNKEIMAESDTSEN